MTNNENSIPYYTADDSIDIISAQEAAKIVITIQLKKIEIVIKAASEKGDSHAVCSSESPIKDEVVKILKEKG